MGQANCLAKKMSNIKEYKLLMVISFVTSLIPPKQRIVLRKRKSSGALVQCMYMLCLCMVYKATKNIFPLPHIKYFYFHSFFLWYFFFILPMSIEQQETYVLKKKISCELCGKTT